jgi:Holliday junction resolvasome RuvABC endonuclease subunit
MASWVWGCDPSSKHVAFAALERDGDRREFFQLDVLHQLGTSRAEKLWNIAQALPAFIIPHAKQCPPMCVYVEVPAGRPNPTLTGAYGVIIAALWGTLSALYQHPVSVWSIDSRTWKKAAIGKGNASKEVIHAWARAEGVDHPSGDILDAFGIATAGLLELGGNP